MRHCKVRADSDTFARLGAKQDRVAQAQCSAVQSRVMAWMQGGVVLWYPCIIVIFFAIPLYKLFA